MLGRIDRALANLVRQPHAEHSKPMQNRQLLLDATMVAARSAAVFSAGEGGGRFTQS